jgi:Transposase DDE domain group 1
VKVAGSRPRIMVSADGRGVAGHAGTRLLADVAEATGLTGRFGEALGSLRRRRGGHDPGRVAVDLAVMLADGGEAIADVGVLRDQPGLFGKVASDATAWRVLSGMDRPPSPALAKVVPQAERQQRQLEPALPATPIEHPLVAIGGPVVLIVLASSIY